MVCDLPIHQLLIRFIVLGIILSHGVDLRLYQETVGYPENNHATATLEGIFLSGRLVM